jgi:hypothetical protein
MLSMNYKTLCFHAKRLNCFHANQAGKRIRKKPSKEPVSLQEIFSGKYVTTQTHKLKSRLIKEGLKSHECECCRLSSWLGKAIPLELHHIDGNRQNNSFCNLQLLCPNCHALTSNYRAKNIRNLSAPVEMREVEPLKFGETFSDNGNPEPSPSSEGKV